MPTLPEAILAAFDDLSGERTIKEIKQWIDERYGERWKDIGTAMADMVPVSHGGNGSSSIQSKYRVLNKVARGTYCLINNENMKEGKILIQSNKEKEFGKISRVQRTFKQPIDQSHYMIHGSKDNMLEVYTSKRLPFEPRGWQLELRDMIRNQLKMLHGDGISLKAVYKSMDQSFFDVENCIIL